MTKRRGRKRGLRATLIHVSSGQIIYHLVQTNGVLDSLSEEEEGGVWGPWGLPATLQPDPHHSSSYLSSSALSSLLLRHRHQALVTTHRAAHRGKRAAEEVPRLHFTLVWHFPSTGVSYVYFYLKLSSVLHWSSPVQRISAERAKLWVSIHLFLCASRLRVCAFMSSMWRKREGWSGGRGGCGCIWTLGSRLNRLSHPQPSPSSREVSINNQSL